MNGKSFSLLLLVLVMVGMGGCQAAPAPAPATAAEGVWAEYDCSTPGTTQSVAFESAYLGYSYTFKLYLPPCYDSMPGWRYPVIYLLPGAGGSSEVWFSAGVAQAADDAILSRSVPPFIIIATANIQSDSYGNVIVQDLVPYVEEYYRVSEFRQHHAAAGGSLGGIGAYRLALMHPAYFSSAGMFGSGVISGEEPRVREWLSAISPEETPRLFFNCGTEDSLMLEQAHKMIALLDEAELSHQEVFSQGGHTYSYWVSNFPAYLRWLAEDW